MGSATHTVTHPCGQQLRLVTHPHSHPPMGSAAYGSLSHLATKPRVHPPTESLTCEVMRSPVHMITHSHCHPLTWSPTQGVISSHSHPPMWSETQTVHPPTWSPTHVVTCPCGHQPMRPLTHGVTCPRRHPIQTLASAEVRASDVRQRPQFRQQGLTGVSTHEFLLLKRAGGLDSDPKDVHVLAPCGRHNNVHTDVHILSTS